MKALKFLAWTGAVIVALLVIAYVGVFHFGLLEVAVNHNLNKLIGGRAPLNVSIGEIRGDILNGLIIENVVVEYDDGNRRYRMASIPKITSVYSLSNLWSGSIAFDALIIDSAVFEVHQDSSGEWLIPFPSGSSGGGFSFGVSSIAVHDLALNSNTFHLVSLEKNITLDNVNILMGFQIDERGMAFDLRGANMVSDYEESEIVSARGKLTLSAENAVFTDIDIDMGKISASMSGMLKFGDEPGGRLSLQKSRIDMDYLSRLLGLELSGQLSVSGVCDFSDSVITGPFEIAGEFMGRSFEEINCDLTMIKTKTGITVRADTIYGLALNGCGIQGKMEFEFSEDEVTYAFDGAVRNFDLSQLVFGSPESDINGLVTALGSGLRSTDMIVNLDVTLDESRFADFHLHSSEGSMTITTDSVRFHPGFMSVYFNNKFQFSGAIEYEGEIDLHGTAHFRNLQRFAGITFIDRPAGRARASCQLTGKLADPNLKGKLWSDSLWLYEIYAGRSWYEFSIDRIFSARQGWASGYLRDISAWDTPVDSVIFAVRIDSNIITADSIRVHSGETHLRMEGKLDYAPVPIPIVLTDAKLDFQGRTYDETEPVRIDYDTLGLTINALSMSGKDGKFSATGRLNFSDEVDLKYELKDVDLAPWLSLLPYDMEMNGKLSCSGEMKGTIVEPEFSLEGSLDSLYFQDLLIGDITTDFNYGNKLLTINRFDVESYPGKHSITGTVPIDPGFDGQGGLLFPSAQFLEVNSRESRFDFVSLLLTDVEELIGSFESNMLVRGTPLNPLLYGSARLSNGKIKIYQMEIPSDSFALEFTMNGRQVDITSGAAWFPPRLNVNGKSSKFDPEKFGHVTITGGMEILGIDSIDYAIDVNMTNLPINYTLGAFRGKADAQLRVMGITPPTVEGEIQLSSALYEEEFLPEDAGYALLTQFERPEAWNVDVDIEIPKNCRVRNSELEAEFKGTANVRRSLGLWSFVYNLEFIRGKLYMPPGSWQIDPGGTVLNDDYAVNNPKLNIVARTKIRVPDLDRISSEPGKSRQKIAVIQISGNLESPIVSPFDDPDVREGEKISNDQLYTAIAFGGGIGGNNTATALTEHAARYGASLITADLSRFGARSIGVETFDIDPNVDLVSSQLTLGLYVLPNLYTYGRSDIGVTGQELGFEAYIGRRLLVQGRRDENDFYFLFLNFGWDY
ncbi:MAG: translocation/assembly module TamB domain-containing protein [candidate division Zixibacteria bacterium]|nr:translocation/assembly module TamB domain-containing protein [candidate division Zixibacteria bacterium]